MSICSRPQANDKAQVSAFAAHMHSQRLRCPSALDLTAEAGHLMERLLVIVQVFAKE